MTKTVLITGALGNLGTKLRDHFATLGWTQRLLDIDAGGDPAIIAADLATYDESWDRIEFFGIGPDGQETATNEFSVVLLPRAQAGLLECVDRLNDRDVLDILTAAEAHAGDSGIRINAQTIEKARRHLRLLARDRGADVLWALMQPADAGEG